MSGAGGIRGDLEHHREVTPEGGRDPFAVDERLVLAALEFTWGDCYRIAVLSGVWTAKRRDGRGGEIEEPTPDALNRAMREDWGLSPVFCR